MYPKLPRTPTLASARSPGWPRASAVAALRGVEMGVIICDDEIVDELRREFLPEKFHRFMDEHNIKPESMTPDQARSVLRAINESQDPRIRNYREIIRRLQLFYRLRTGGRGSE